MKWKRLPQGYLSADGEWFLERGAPMVGGNTNAWLIHRRVGPERVGQEDTSCFYDQRSGMPLWALDDEGFTSTARPPYDGPLYAHDWDAGSLAEAKYVAETVSKEV